MKVILKTVMCLTLFSSFASAEVICGTLMARPAGFKYTILVPEQKSFYSIVPLNEKVQSLLDEALKVPQNRQVCLKGTATRLDGSIFAYDIVFK